MHGCCLMSGETGLSDEGTGVKVSTASGVLSAQHGSAGDRTTAREKQRMRTRKEGRGPTFWT